MVHEWNSGEPVSLMGKLKEKYGFTLLFHDTHHRMVSAPEEMNRYDLSAYDGVLAFGEIIKNMYLKNGQTKNAWTWHEAADTSLFYPRCSARHEGISAGLATGAIINGQELDEYLIRPVKELGLKATIYGVRYPKHALEKLKEAGIRYGGWLPNHRVPEVLASTV